MQQERQRLLPGASTLHAARTVGGGVPVGVGLSDLRLLTDGLNGRASALREHEGGTKAHMVTVSRLLR